MNMVDYIDGEHKLHAMPPLLQKIRGRVFSRVCKSLRVVVLGSQGVGKTGKQLLL